MIALDVTNPDVHVVIEVGRDVAIHRGSAAIRRRVLEGDAVDVLEQLSMRAPFDPPGTDDDRWLFQGLAEVFDQTV